ncbi:MAG: hypothetical protein J7L07_09170 [Candidatus Odinarchaeota archaeon]|nr:hypothetical protein [Candidatus Odinarchaeota archaeon]
MRELGFSPFGGVNIVVKPMGGIATKEVPSKLKQQVKNRPLIPPIEPQDGWELVGIKQQEEATHEGLITTSKGKFIVKVRAEVLMVARNLLYKTITDEPIYRAMWIYKVSWIPAK